jgi:hypothetical protein
VEGSHRAALIHREGTSVKGWSYQLKAAPKPRYKSSNPGVVLCVEVQETDHTIDCSELQRRTA